jgi:catechol 2,3-dioxygenase-like lactoylglutathione lyase family enzyme
MSSAGVTSEELAKGGRHSIDMDLEVIVIPVADADRAKGFYEELGWRLDADVTRGDSGFRLLQFTPPGSGCSVQFGVNLTDAAPGSSQSYLVVSDIELARELLVERGVSVSEVFYEGTLGGRFGEGERETGSSPDRSSYGSYASFGDPDGNSWLLQEVTTRLPGRIDPTSTSFASTSALASALRRAEAAHGEHEKKLGKADPNWPDWYADYLVREQTGDPLPS